MGNNLGFYAGNEDRENLMEFTREIGLCLLSFRLGQTVAANPFDGPACNLSLFPEEDLHPYGDPPLRISRAIDPMLFFERPYYKEPYLVLGQIQWYSDAPEVSLHVKPHFQKIRRWVRKNWNKEGDFYIGPEATKLLLNGAQKCNFHPEKAKDINFSVIEY